MNGLPYYRAYPRDFIDGTVGMPFEVKCAYRVILDLIYMHGGRLPDDARYISGVLNCSLRKWTSLREAMIAWNKVAVENRLISNYRADKEIETTAKYQDNQRQNALAPRKNKGLPKPPQSHTDTDTDTVSREGKPSLALLPKPTRFDEFWNAYPHRGGKKGRKPSLAKYIAAVKAGTSEQDIIDAAIRYGSDRRVQAGYVKMPETWLNKGSWEDEIDVTPETTKGHANGKPATSGHGRLMAFIAGASAAPRMDSGPDSNTSQPLLARR